MQYPKMMSAISGAVKPAGAILMAAAMMLAVSGQTMATPAISQKTSQPCAKCHTAPPTLNDYGKKYKETEKK